MDPKSKDYTGWIIAISIALVAIITILFFLPQYSGEVGFDVTILPLLNAIFNCFTFLFLLSALIAVKRRNIPMHRSLILMAFVTTTLFLVSYVIYHFLTEPTSFGGGSTAKAIYFFVLISHILLAIVNVPLALLSVTRGFSMQVEKHRRIARWTMPIWLYVSLTGVIVYLMISPYY